MTTLVPGRQIRWCILLPVFMMFSVTWSQTYGDKKFYLVDSLDLELVSVTDRTLLDTSLALFHKAAHDTIALDLIEHIVDECWNEAVWPKYNTYLYLAASMEIKHTQVPEEQKKLASLIAGSVSNFGYICDNEGNVPGALIYYHRALEIYERINDYNGCASGFNNLGVLYSAQGDTAKSLFYHNESLRLKKRIGDNIGVALSLNNIGTLYKEQGRTFEALHCFEKSLRISKELNDERVMAISYDNIAGIYFNEGYPTKAIDYYNKALQIREINGEYSGAAFSLNNIASVYLSMDQVDKAQTYAERSLLLAEEIAYPMDIQNAAQTLYDIFKLRKNYEKALYYHELFIDMRDSLHNVINERATLAQSLKYEYEKESLKDSLQNQKIQEIKDSKISEQNAVIGKEKTFRYALIIVLVLMAYVVFISVRNYMRKQRDNELIQNQKNEVESQKQKIEKQHHILEETYKEISDSITYAKRIQQAILPPVESVSNAFRDSFVWYQPKNVVSGDFYWMEKIDHLLILAVADCTGHGVPGAMVSVVCHNALNRSVFEFGITEPNLILDKTRQLVIETFDKSGSEVKDGMDISLICIDTIAKKMTYAGANNNIYIIRRGLKSETFGERSEISLHDTKLCTLIELKSDKQPIGRFSKARDFTKHELMLYADDRIYLFSDGLADQFGGPKGKKFKYQQFKEILVQNHQEPMENQLNELSINFESWKGELEQVDDICVIGVTI
ncbi:MAG: tetratricopeptide repeat protein [Bacteroidetes bacterium]|nr:tetratricopeptide repeat protein [Bacteroidota bacterium]